MRGFVGAPSVNLPFLRTKGIDFEANYNADMADWGWKGVGSLSFNFLGTYLDSLETQPVPAAAIAAGTDKTFDCKGLFGIVCGNPNPKWRHKLRVTWSSPWDFDLSLNWRYLSGVKFDGNESNTNLNDGLPISTSPTPRSVRSTTSTLLANWTVSQGVELRAGVDNIFDKDPPVVDSNSLAISSPPFGNGNTFPGVYDSLGRTIFVGATIKY